MNQIFNNYHLKLKSINKKILHFYINFLKNIYIKLNIKFNIVMLPIKTKRITLLRSPHVFKKSREQFQITSYTSLICIKNFNFSTQLLKFLYLNKPNLIKITIRKIV